MMTIRTMSGFLLALVFCTYAGAAQEVECNIQVNYEAVPTTNADLLRDFSNDVKTYVSNYNWGLGNSQDKVKCTLNIFIQSVIGENRYAAQVFIGSQRLIFNSEQSTAVIRLFDELWEFTYIRGRPINHSQSVYNDLTSFLDFYMFLILGFDNDTYEKFSGNPPFQKAAEVASLGRSTGQKGWQPSNSNYSRIQLIDEILNPAFEPIRIASWRYHFCGLDSISTNKPRALANILHAVRSIGELRKKVDVRNLLIKTFFEAKAKELADLFLDYPDPSVYDIMYTADPSHVKTYEEARQKRK